MKKVYLLTACVLALSLSACDSKEQKQTTTKTDTPTTPTPTTPTTPVEPAQNIEPTTPAATAPFAINITDIKDFYGFSLHWSRVHLLDKDDKFLKTIELNNQNKPKNEWITTAKFENLTAGNEYKVCLQTFNLDRLENGNTPETSKICDYYLTNGDNLSKTQKQIFNAGLDKKMVLPKEASIIVKGLIQNQMLNISADGVNELAVFIGSKDGNHIYYKTAMNTKVAVCGITGSDYDYLYKCYNKLGEFISKNIKLSSNADEDARVLENTKIMNDFFATLPKYNLDEITEITF